MEKIIKLQKEATEKIIKLQKEPFIPAKSQEKSINLNFLSGDMIVTPDSGDLLLSKVNIIKPNTLIPENIIEDVNIGGVVGNRHIPTVEERTVAVNFHDGDVIVMPENADTMSQVTVEVPILPTLNNPTTANDILEGKEAIDENGEVLTGTLSLEPVEPHMNDVILYDYDGRIAYSYSKNDFLALTEYPPNPTHKGLLGQGWNWSFSDAQAYVQKYGGLDIGQMYITDDGATRYYLEFPQAFSGDILFYVGQSKVNGLKVYKDNSDEYVISPRTGAVTLHYDNPIYSTCIRLVPDDDCTLTLVDISPYPYNNAWLLPCIKKVEIGKNVTTLGQDALKNFGMMSAITIPHGVTTFNTYCLSNTYSLKTVIFPDTLLKIDANMYYNGRIVKHNIYPNTSVQYPYIHGGIVFDRLFYSRQTVPQEARLCEMLSHVVLSENIVDIANRTFEQCSALQKINIPVSVANIGNNAFLSCARLKEIHLYSATPPTVQSTSFSKINANAVFYIHAPDALQTYQEATNWSAFADQMVQV